MALMFQRLARNFAKNGYFPTDEKTTEGILLYSNHLSCHEQSCPNLTLILHDMLFLHQSQFPLYKTKKQYK
jgi:hypothetical protein